jgi:predicted nucleic acid-binding protein
MTYLLDVNALLALGFAPHIFHQRMEAWLGKLSAEMPIPLATCALTELGFVRILPQLSSFQVDVGSAKQLLRELKADVRVRFEFISDDQGADRLPLWVTKSKETTDGHLVELAKAQGAELATLDEGIPDAFLIP